MPNGSLWFLYGINLRNPLKKGSRVAYTSYLVNGVVTVDENKVEEKVTNYFHALFNGYHDADLNNTGASFVPDNSELNTFLQGLDSLPDNERDDLTKDMTMDELEDIVKKCKHNKSPGLDGLSYEFYQETFNIIK